MLIAMAVWDTSDNMRTEMTLRTLQSLAGRVNWDKHRLFISDNGSCSNTQDLYRSFCNLLPFTLIQNRENIGTARAINRAWSYRQPGEHAVKMDNDVVVNHTGWADEIEDALNRDPTIGICGLKRKDFMEVRPDHPIEHYRSYLRILPHQIGERWIVVEEAHYVIGTCQAYSSALLEKIGYLYQGDWKYGFDDALAGLRSSRVGFKNAFLPHIDLDHIDPGGTDYTQQKMIDAGLVINKYAEIALEYRNGMRPVFFDGGEDAKWAELHSA